MNKPTMTTTKPYFLRAVYDWIVDNNCTPHLVADTTAGGCVVPQQFVKDGVIVLNISPTAVRDFAITSDHVSFSARFGGVAQEVFVPVPCVRALYAKENGQGLAIEDAAEFAEESGAPAPSESSEEVKKGRKPPRLTIVK